MKKKATKKAHKDSHTHKETHTERKFTLRDSGGVLDEAEEIIKNKFPKPSLNTWIIEAIQAYNHKHLPS